MYTLDNQVISFIKVEPMNLELFSDEELETKMNLESIEFSNEQFPYKILVMPKSIDISEYIKEQEELKKQVENEVSIEIINKRISDIKELIENKNMIENEFYIMIYTDGKENVESELMKRANNWDNRLKSCDLQSKMLDEKEIILLIKSFTISELARTEETDYTDNIVKIKRKEAND